MASLQQSTQEITHLPNELLVARITQIHASISNLESLKPSKEVNRLFTQLVKLCTLPSSITINALPLEVQVMRKSLINLCGLAEGLLEFEFATLLSNIAEPMQNLSLFPYYGNYVKLASLEYQILMENGVMAHPSKIAFVGSGPMPLTSIVMATRHMKFTHFDNYDIDKSANHVASQIVESDTELGKRMKFITCDIMEVKEKLEEYDCIFLAALVGMNKEDKMKIIEHIRKYMKKGAYLIVRSANGSRAFLYPVVEEQDLIGFEVLSIFHPTDDVINSVVLARKPIH